MKYYSRKPYVRHRQLTIASAIQNMQEPDKINDSVFIEHYVDIPATFQGKQRKGTHRNITSAISNDGHIKQATQEPSMFASGAPLRRHASRSVDEIARPADSVFATTWERRPKTSWSISTATWADSAAWYSNGPKSTQSATGVIDIAKIAYLRRTFEMGRPRWFPRLIYDPP